MAFEGLFSKIGNGFELDFCGWVWVFFLVGFLVLYDPIVTGNS